MTSLAFICKYTLKNSVGHDPMMDNQIGENHGAVGCGRVVVKGRGLQCFTLANERLIYNGPLGAQLDINPWAASGKKWKTYKVPHHHDLGNVYTVLDRVGLPRNFIKDVNRRNYVSDPEVKKLIDYALSVVGGASAH